MTRLQFSHKHQIEADNMSFHIFIGEGKRELKLSVDEFLKRVRRRLHGRNGYRRFRRHFPPLSRKRGNILHGRKEIDVLLACFIPRFFRSGGGSILAGYFRSRIVFFRF